MTGKENQEPTIGVCINSEICAGFPEAPVLIVGLVHMMDGSIRKTPVNSGTEGTSMHRLVNWIRKQKSVDPEKYLAVLERIPQMEQISKVNLPKLTKECFKFLRNSQ